MKLRLLQPTYSTDDKIMNHFFSTLLPEFDLADGMEKIDAHVILAAGEKDYDSAPLELWNKFRQPRNFYVLNCGFAGHWPHIESDIFDKGVIDWAEAVFSGVV